MLDTRDVQTVRRFAVCGAALWGALACLAQSGGAARNLPPQGWQSAVAAAARMAPQARIVVLDIGDGRLLSAKHLDEAAHTLANPGSAIKPLVLYGLISTGRWDPTRRLFCSRKLSIDGHSLNCSHPMAEPMDARQALAWSCNTYFATVAETLKPGELRRLLAPTGLLGQTGLANGEAAAEFRDPQTIGQNRLAVLGVDGVRVTPLELALGYRWLAVQLAAHPDSAAALTVRAGLEDSASFGMAGAASLGGVPVAGKTGTASAATGGQTHGWFIGLAPSNAPLAAIVVYLPAGHGSDAARVAAELLAHSPLRRP
jgi:cell division protein FtsI/penicillin-binding protein 2